MLEGDVAEMWPESDIHRRPKSKSYQIHPKTKNAIAETRTATWLIREFMDNPPQKAIAVTFFAWAKEPGGCTMQAA
jgi:hypothetical protein